MQNFISLEAAWEWVEAMVDDPCVDNYRFTYVDDPIGESLYESISLEGCCGFFDEEIMINGRLAKIGCNYGH